MSPTILELLGLTLFLAGVTVWELMTFGAHPYHGKPTEDMLKALEDGQRLHQPVTVTAELYSILVECKYHRTQVFHAQISLNVIITIGWWLDPMMRPSFNKMVKTMGTCQSNPSQYVLTMVSHPNDTCGAVFKICYTGG